MEIKENEWKKKGMKGKEKLGERKERWKREEKGERKRGDLNENGRTLDKEKKK